MKTYKGIITKLEPNGIFVFGSNTEGRHGAGSSLAAKTFFGAVYGQAKGRQGRSYGIITKDLTKSKHPSVSKEAIIEQITELYEYASSNPELDFFIAYSGTGTNLNYYTNNEMAEFFRRETIPQNIIFEEKFAELICNNVHT